MCKLVPFRWLLTLLLGLGSLLAAQATHVQGGDIAYTSIASTTLGVPRYHVVLRVFGDARAIPVSNFPALDLLVRRGGNCPSGVSGSYFTVPVAFSQVIHGPVLACGAGGSAYDVNLYAADLDLPLPLGPWTMSFNVAPPQMMNIPSQQDVTVEAFLDNALARNKPDTSPQFESVLQPAINFGLAAPPHSFSAFDPDGDSLSYELVLPRQPYLPGTNGCLPPVASSSITPSFTINAVTGALLPVGAPAAPAQGYYSLLTRVNEYRRQSGQWQLIGYVLRHTLHLLYATPNQAPTFTALSLNGGPAQLPGVPIAAYAGQTVHLTLTATDPDPSQLIRFASEAPNVIPGLTLTTLNATQARLDWTLPTAMPPGNYAIAVAVLDNGCPYSASEERTLVFQVSAQPLATHPATAATAAAYPMPFREQVQFQAEAGGQPVTIVDALGRVVAQLNAAADGRVRWLPAATLPAGLYLARGADGRVLARLLRAAE